MPIKIANELPAVRVLQSENIFVMPETRALSQDIRPLKIALLNLMPDKITTETQFARLLSNSALQVELELIRVSSHVSKNTSASHIAAFYKTFEECRHNRYDGMIITGAPVERLPFEEVDYWQELTEIMDWSRHNVFSTLHICWAAQAGLYHHFGIGKQELPKKISGVFAHTLVHAGSKLFRGCDDVFMLPHSRHTTIDEAAVRMEPRLSVLAKSDEAGSFALAAQNGKQIFFTGHAEYDALTLEKEYLRDRAAGLKPAVPLHYYPDNDPSRRPQMTWRAHAHLIFANWLNYFVYQETPYDLAQLS